MTIARARATLSAADLFTSFGIGGTQAEAGQLGLSLAGEYNISIQEGATIWVGTITLQRSFDGGIIWKDIERFVDSDPAGVNIEKIGNAPKSGTIHRIGFKAGEYTSGDAIVELNQ